jgi:Carboxypeptidase regulatory-like domain/TonB-dependent Receptor Plug Domain
MLLLLLATIAPAQNTSGVLSGVVQDASGAPFSDLEVRLTSSDNGFLRKTRTNQAGSFSFPDLSGGTYSIDIATQGFKHYSQSGIGIEAGEQRMLGPIQLALGEVTETVSVTSDSSHVKLNSSERSVAFDQQQLSELTLRGEDLMDAVSLLPGVTDTSSGRETSSSKSMNDIFILGGRSNQKNMTVDGVTNLDTGSNRSVQTMPSLGTVAEVQVLSANYAAEYGRNSGGGISIITRGGGRQLHGLAAWSHRNEEFNANEFFNNANGQPRAPYRYNVFDFTLGGPIYIPGRFNQDRSKLFFFVSEEYQGQLVNYGQRKVTVPTGLERQGDFSQTFDVNGKLFPVLDPLNARKAFPGNKIPSSRFDSSGSSLLNLFPLPNFVDPNKANRYEWNYISNATGPEPRRMDMARIDYARSSAIQFYGRYSRYADTQQSPYGSGANFPLTTAVLNQPGWTGTFHVATTFTPTMFGEFIFGVSQRKLENSLQDPNKVSRATTGVDIAEWKPGASLADPLPMFSFGGVAYPANPSISYTLPRYISNTIFNLAENVTKVSGTHTVKFGVSFERSRIDRSADVPVRGLISFDQDGNNPNDANYPFATALLGNYDYYQEASSRPQGQYRFTNLEWYVQDNWRVRRNLTLDFGLRLYHDPAQYDARGQLNSFIPGFYNLATAPVLLTPGLDKSGKRAAINPVTGASYPVGLIGTFAPGVGNPIDGMVRGGTNGTPGSLYSVPPLSLGPRTGFAWDPFGNGRTAVRGGVGVFYDRIAGQPTIDTFKNPPNVYLPESFYGTLAGLAAAAGSGVLAPSSVVTLYGAAKMPITFNYSLGVQRQIGHTMMVDVAYVGSESRHLLWQRNINPVPAGADHVNEFPQFRDPTIKSIALPPNFMRPYLGYGDIFAYEFGSSSNYNSLQASLNRRFSRGLRAGFSYTFSKVLGTADQDTARVSPFFAPRSRNYGPLSYDRAHVVAVSYTYTLPKPGQVLHWRPAGVVTDNWEISGITRMSSGGPFTPGFTTTDGQDITGTPSEYPRLMVANPKADAVNRFGRPPLDSFGNVGVGSLRLPGFDNWDMALYRRISLTERIAAQLRFETYNTFNHTQFSSLSTVATFNPAGKQIDPLFLTPTAARSSRKIQMAIRLNW